KILREVCDDLGINKKFPPSLFRAYISQAKNLVQTPAEMNIGLSGELKRWAEAVYAQYQNFLHTQNGLDFDDLLMLVVKLFELDDKLLARYQNIFQYVLVDEYQDTNHVQYRLLQLIAGQHRNLFVVGDDAQSIYGFRGS